MHPKNKQAPKLSLSVQYADARWKDTVSRALLRRWAQAALFAPAELTFRFVDAEEGRTLNREFRGKDYATNVLTFAYTEDGAEDSAENGDEISEVTQADIVFCTDVVEQEAAAQRKPLLHHVAHLVVHGVLHAQGYDHETDEEAEEMEALETEILAGFQIRDPYATAEN